MAFKADHLTKFNQLDRFVKQQRSSVGPKAGEASANRTKRRIALGESQAVKTKNAMRSSAEGVRNIFRSSGDDVESTSSLSRDLQNASWMQGIDEESEENRPKDSYDPLKLEEDLLKLSEELYGKKGVQAGRAAPHSYFNEPIVEGGLRGNSRAAGDISPELQNAVVTKIVDVGSKLGMTDYEIAYTLATVRHESGFNPDASAKSSSARGLGQFINKTGASYGLNADNQWDVDAQVQAVLEHTQDNFRMAAQNGYSNEYVYALHHDGPTLSSGGLGKSKKHIMPYVPKYLKLIESFRGEE